MEQTFTVAVAELRAIWEKESEDLARKNDKVIEERQALELDRARLMGQLDQGHRDLKLDRIRLLIEIDEERRALELDRAEWAAEISKVEEATVRLDALVRVDVGGTHYTTKRSTLTAVPGSMLEVMFGGRHEKRLNFDEEGRVLIDRNGTMFYYVLEFLRGYSSGDENAAFAIRALPDFQMKPMRIELDYYGIEDAVFPLPPFKIEQEIFSPGPEMSFKRHAFGAVSLHESRGVLIIGGRDGTNNVASTELLDINTDMFTCGPSMISKRRKFATAVLDDGRVVVIGGKKNGSRNASVLSTTEVLDPFGNTWSPGPEMVSGRGMCAALPLTDNSILVIGGWNGCCLSTTEVIDLATGTSTPGPDLSTPRRYSPVVMLDDGRILVIGGYDGKNRLSTTEILDLTSGTSSPGPEMSSARAGSAAVLLPEGGGVLVIGGEQKKNTALATTEVLDVDANTTSLGPELGSRRAFCGAVMLPKDRILVIGGYDGTSHLSTSEELCIPTVEEMRQKRRCAA